MNVLDNLDQDVFLYQENRYRIKRYAYWAFNGWIDENKKPIKERVFSFIVYHGNVWDNSTSTNILESELDSWLPTMQAKIARVRQERREHLTAERAARKLFPKVTALKFNNVTLVAVESLKYYGSWADVEKKEVRLYANNRQYRYPPTVPIETEITCDWILEHVTGRVLCQDVEKLPAPNTVHTYDRNFVPHQFYINYVVAWDGVQYAIRDFMKGCLSDSRFLTDKGDLYIPITELHRIDVIGEVQGIAAMGGLINKLKFME